MRHPTPIPIVWDAVNLSITNPAEVETQFEIAVDTLLPAAGIVGALANDGLPVTTYFEE